MMCQNREMVLVCSVIIPKCVHELHTLLAHTLGSGCKSCALN